MADLKNPVKAIRAKCLECSAQNPVEVRLCPVTECALYPFRLGKNPYRKPVSEEQRRLMSERAKKTFQKNFSKGKELSE